MEYFIEKHKFNFRQFTLYSTFIKIANRKVFNLREMIKPKNFWLPELSLFGDLLKIERFLIITSKFFFQKRI